MGSPYCNYTVYIKHAGERDIFRIIGLLSTTDFKIKCIAQLNASHPECKARLNHKFEGLMHSIMIFFWLYKAMLISKKRYGRAWAGKTVQYYTKTLFSPCTFFKTINIPRGIHILVTFHEGSNLFITSAASLNWDKFRGGVAIETWIYNIVLYIINEL